MPRCRSMPLLPAILVLCTLSGRGWAGDAPIRFEHLTINDGLPENSVRAIMQDRDGFLWFGTQNGLARYDGVRMESFLPDPGRTGSIGIRTLLSLAEGRDGGIWIGSYSAGVSRYDPRLDSFTNYAAEGDSLPGSGVPAIRVTDDGVWFCSGGGAVHRWTDGAFTTLDVPPFTADRHPLTALEINDHEVWVGAESGGLAWQDRATGTWRHLRHDAADPFSLPSDFVTFVWRDDAGRLWVGGRAGLGLHRGDGRFTVYRPRPSQGASEANYLLAMDQDADGTYWVGAANGLYRFDPDSGSFELFAHDPLNPDSPVRGPVLSVLCDASGVVWGGSWHTGLNKHDPGGRKFEIYAHDPAVAGSLADDAIGAVFEDSRGTLWVGTGGLPPGGIRGGLYRRDPGADGFRRLSIPELPTQRVRTINAITEGQGGVIWLGSNVGLWQVDPDCDCLVRPRGLPSLPTALVSGPITDMMVDGTGCFWVTAYGAGVYRFDPVAGSWSVFRADPDDPRAMPRDQSVSVCSDDLGRVWIGMDSGELGVYDSGQDAIRRVPLPGLDLEGITSIVAADSGRIWVSSVAGALLCDPDGVVRSWSVRNGLPSDETGQLLVDRRGAVWVSTGLGLARIDETSRRVTVFDRRDGLLRNEIFFAACRTAGGRLFFGGHYGLVSVHPDSLRTNAHVPPVYVTELRVRDQRLGVGEDSPLQQALPHAREIRLDHTRNDLTLGFAALDFARPERNEYRYRLDPYDADWRTPASRRAAHYTSLDPGRYTFSVMGSNGDGVWNTTAATLDIVITPPWWRSGPANAVYALVVFAGFLLVYRQIVNRERMRTALEIERAEARHLQDLDQLKSRFFANISHEFRTPLTLLSAPLRRLQDDPQSGSAELFGTMARNARRLARLIDQLLDLSRLEADRMPARWRRGDWLTYLRAMVSPFATAAEQRGIVLNAAWPAQAPVAWYEADLLDKVLGNLLTNALKFTPAGGEISVTAGLAAAASHPWPGQADGDGEAGEAHLLTLGVTNTGSHIPADEIDHVFDRFHQVVEQTDHGDLGSGIGLALVKELVEWCGGSVAVRSDRSSGTTFTAVLPLYVAPPPGAAAAAEAESARAGVVPEDAQPGVDDEDEVADTGLPTVLMAEDNADLRAYVRSELADEFRVLVAANGRAALDLARDEIPDLVLSDVMMPEMDGLELCRMLKSDDLTNHVPIILLTARAESDSRKEGLQTGADDYVAKPFDVEELRIRARNLIAQRRLLAERYAQLEVARPGRAANPVTSADDRFLARIREIIAENIDDPDFRVDALCREIGMSRTQLHRKLTAVAGRSAGEFLRLERLNRAAEMLGEGESNVTEVAYSVGYRSLSQFAKAFREQFGMAPSDFQA
jgi:signal transduction histidine kinase/ligand-binding sensor domain-containing protein/DNA-binding response OmpR family regulator